MNKFFNIMYFYGAILVASFIFFNKSPIAFNYFSTWLIIGLLFLVAGFLINSEATYDEEGKGSVGIISGIGIIGIAFVILIAGGPFLPSMSEKYTNLVEVKEANLSNFNTHEETTRRVTLDMAVQISNKVLGIKHDGTQLSSQYEIDKTAAAVQEVNGELIWVLPLDYSGIMKWLDLDYIPGYIKLSATDPKAKASIVLDKKITISNNAYWSDNIERQVWYKSGLKKTLTHYEIDDEGNPYYISAVIEPEILFNADGIKNVIITDAQSGAMETLSIAEVGDKYPWIDRIWPEEIIQERIKWHGSLQDGFLNSIFAQKNVSVPTKYINSSLWLVKAGDKLNWFTGMTSTNQNDQSLVSAVFVESTSVSSKPILHVVEMSMVSDEGGAIYAIDSALGADSVKWDVALPQPYIIDNEFYWTAVVISGSNIFQKKAYMKGDDISNVSFDSLKVVNPIVGGSTKALSNKEEIMVQIMQKLKELEELRKLYESLEH